MFWKKKDLIGLDVGSRFIKIVEMSYHPKGSRLKRFSMVPTPPGSIYGSEIKDIEAIGYSIKTALEQEGFSKLNFCVGIGGGNSVTFKKLTIPKVDTKLLPQTIRYEAEQYVGGDLSNFLISHHLLNNALGDNQINALVVIAQKGYVEKLVALERILGRKIQIVDYSAFALANVFTASQVGSSMGVHLLLHIGALNSLFIIMVGGEVEYVREILFGGQNCTLDIQKELGLSLEEAESMKLAYGKSSDLPDLLPKVIESFFDALIEEIRNPLEYFQSIHAGASTINSLMLSGGGSLMFGIHERLERALNIPVQLLNISSIFKSIDASIQISPVDLSAFGAIGVGLAMRTMGDS